VAAAIIMSNWNIAAVPVAIALNTARGGPANRSRLFLAAAVGILTTEPLQ
jgi:hypothetical protein